MAASIRRTALVLVLTMLAALLGVMGTAHAGSRAVPPGGWAKVRAPRPSAPPVPSRGPDKAGDPAASVPDGRSLPRAAYPAAGTHTIVVGEDRPASGSPVSARAVDGEKDKPSRLRVRTLPPAKATLVGARGLAFQLDRADSVQRSARVSATISYAGFRHAYGANFADRIRLLRYPSCVLDHPTDARCAHAEQLPAHNERAAGDLTAVLSAGAAGHPDDVYALTGGPSGEKGSFAATTLNPAGSWTVGLNAGDFQYSYPVPTPPAIGGAPPGVGLSYSSASVDGRSSASNNQASWIGMGWDYNPGYLERDFASCKDAGHPEWAGDLCWGLNNASLALGDQSGMLIQDNGDAHRWHLRDDSGTHIEQLSGVDNGDDASEYWRVSTLDGTQYFFGSQADHSSTWTVPVFGAAPTTEKCRHADPEPDACVRAWRWNLDKIVDKDGNVTLLRWARDVNHYARHQTATAVSAYDSGGYPSEIDYGLRVGAESASPPARVLFTAYDRCADDSPCTGVTPTSPPDQYPDTPLDLMCVSTASCPGQFSPVFFTSHRLAHIQTQVLVPANPATRAGCLTHQGDCDVWRDVDQFDLAHSFPSNDDGTKEGLWLARISRTGVAQSPAITLPPTSFGGARYANRADAVAGRPPLNFWRVTTVSNGMGGHTSISYKQAHPCDPATLPQPAANGHDCYPVYYTPDGAPQPQFGWFNKYVVDRVSVLDDVGGTPAQVTAYEYLDAPAWHHDENLVAPQKVQSWADWRGYGLVRVTSGSGESRSVSTHLYFRGMDGDPNASGPPKSVTVVDSTGARVVDAEQLRGRERESRSFTADGKTEISGDVHGYWQRRTAIGPPGYDAYLVRENDVHGRAVTSTQGPGEVRRTEVVTQYDPATGLPTALDDKGDISSPDDERCMTTRYVASSGQPLLVLPARIEKHDLGCDSDVHSRLESLYDGASDPSQPPTRGDTTEVRSYVDANHHTTKRFAYDGYGRSIASTDANGNRSTIAYAPAADSFPTTATVTDALGHSSTTTVDPTRGLPTAQVDPNGHATHSGYDALGRLVAGWAAGQPVDQPANNTFTYQVDAQHPTLVTSRRLQDTSAGKPVYSPTFAYLDGFGRTLETQSPTPNGTGRILVQTRYDDGGHIVAVTSPTNVSDEAGSGLSNPDPATIPTETRTLYDSLSRATATLTVSKGVEKWRTTTSYYADMTSTRPPVGGESRSYVDARGHVVRTEQDKGDGAHTTTSYTYYPSGETHTVTDPNGNVTSYAYDWLGRRTSTESPDTGHTTATYDNAGNIRATTDANNTTLAYSYDVLGRHTGVRSGSDSGPLLAAWTYDAPGAIGLPHSSTRHADGGDYTITTEGYDPRDRPVATTWTIPKSEGPLAGRYTELYGYDQADHLTGVGYPAAGDLPQETVATHYNDLGMSTVVEGAQTYIAANVYQPDGKLAYRALGAGQISAGRSYSYEADTQRLAGITSEVDMPPPGGSGDAQIKTVQDDHYSYDAVGDMTRVTDSVTGQRQCYDYDARRRLTHAWTSDIDCADARAPHTAFGPAPYDSRYGFDDVDNLLSDTTRTPAGVKAKTYRYPDAGPDARHPNAVQAVDSPDGVDTYGYDDAGQMTDRTVHGRSARLHWDPTHHLAALASGPDREGYVYDADGSRLLRKGPDATTLFVAGMEVRADKATGKVTTTRFYGDGGATVALRTAGGVRWIFGDYQGSSAFTVDEATGQASDRQRYTPFGALRAGQTLPTDHGFLGKVSDASTGLDQLGARYYDPNLASFISPDPLLDTTGQPYGYAAGNPSSFSDPSGLKICAGESRCDLTPYDMVKHNETPEDAGQTSSEYYNLQLFRKLASAATLEEARQAQEAAAAAHAAKARAEAERGSVLHQITHIVLDVLGITDAVNCFTKGDIMGCVQTFLMAIPWGKILKVGKAVFDAFRLVRDFIKAEHAVVEADRAVHIADEALVEADRAAAEAKSAESAAADAEGGAAEANAGAGGCNSFPGGTGVMMASRAGPGGRPSATATLDKPIDQVKTGDTVLATDPLTGETQPEQVQAVIVTHTDHDYTDTTLRTPAGQATITSTQHHPYWNTRLGRWTDATALRPGDRLRQPHGPDAIVIRTRDYQATTTTYNLTVTHLHTYYVLAGPTPVLVHNCGPTVGPRASLDNLTGAERTRIQNAADRIRTPISVVGSRASGTAGPMSDWDYVITGINSRVRHSVSSSLPKADVTVGVGRRQDIFTGPLVETEPYITFHPQEPQ